MSKFKDALNTLRAGDGRQPRSHDIDNVSMGVMQEQDVAADSPPTNNINAGQQDGKPVFRLSISPSQLRDEGLLPTDENMPLASQQFRRIKRPVLKIAFSAGDVHYENANVVMLASALPGTGKTFCSINLATSISHEKDVGSVVVDADVLKPNITRAFGLEERPGLIDFLVDSSLTLEDVLVHTDIHDLIVVPAGKHHEQVTELLSSQRMGEFISLISHRFSSRVVVFDTPPLLLTNEAQVLAQHMGQIVLVIQAGASSQETVSQALASLDRGKPINAILNKARGESFGEYGDYGYYSSPK